jgi:hypothetical protein
MHHDTHVHLIRHPIILNRSRVVYSDSSSVSPSEIASNSLGRAREIITNPALCRHTSCHVGAIKHREHVKSSPGTVSRLEQPKTALRSRL